MSQSFRIGPCRLLVASSISAAPEDWTDTGVTVGGVRATLTAGEIHQGRVSQLSRIGMAAATWLSPGVSRATGRLADVDAVKMAAAIPGAVRVTSGAKVALKLPGANTPITAQAIALVPELDYDDDGVFVGSEHVVWFERGMVVLDTLPGFDPIEDGDTTEMGYEIRVESFQGNVGIGYPSISAPDLNPQGVLFAWQPSLDAITPLAGEGAGTFTRATTATYVDDDGARQTASSGAARYQDGGLLLEPQRTNLFLNSDTLVTQDVTVSATPYTVSFEGTGTITFSGVHTGTLVGTGVGPSSRVSVTFTPTAGTLTCTVSGSVTSAQIEEGSSGTSYIPTAGASATRNADGLSIPFATGLPEEGFTVLWKGTPKSTPGTGDMGMTIGVIGSTTDAAEFKLSAMGDGTIDYSGPSGVSVVTASGGPTLADDTEDDIVAQVSVSGDTVRTFDGDDTAQSTAAIAATTGHVAADDVISRNTSAIPFVLTGLVIAKGILTPAQIRKYLR